MQRRTFLVSTLASLALLSLWPLRALASMWNKAAFEAPKSVDSLRHLGVSNEQVSDQIVLTVPTQAENGAVVQVEVLSRIKGSEAIAIMVENNPTPLIANFLLTEQSLAHVVTRIKMAETSEVKAIVKVGNQYYSAAKRVEVLENGCN